MTATNPKADNLATTITSLNKLYRADWSKVDRIAQKLNALSTKPAYGPLEEVEQLLAEAASKTGGRSR